MVEYSVRYIGPRNPWSNTRFSKIGNKIAFITTNYHPFGYRNGNVYGIFELNEQGYPVNLKTENYVREHFRGSDYWSTTIVAFTWQNGNLTKTEWEREDIDGSSAGTLTFTHDDKKTPFYHCNTPKWILWWLNYCNWNGFNEYYGGHNYGYNENNIKTETRKGGTTITYDYTYNDNGFPVTRAWNAEASAYSETYTYK